MSCCARDSCFLLLSPSISPSVWVHRFYAELWMQPALCESHSGRQWAGHFLCSSSSTLSPNSYFFCPHLSSDLGTHMGGVTQRRTSDTPGSRRNNLAVAAPPSCPPPHLLSLEPGGLTGASSVSSGPPRTALSPAAARALSSIWSLKSKTVTSRTVTLLPREIYTPLGPWRSVCQLSAFPPILVQILWSLAGGFPNL